MKVDLSIACINNTGREWKVRRRALLVLLFFLSGGGEAWSQAGLQKIRIAYASRGIYIMDLYIAKEKGFFREDGLDAELVEVRSANIAVAALVSGELEALGSIGAATRASQLGMPLKVLAVTGHRPLFWLVSRPEYRSIPELKGKTLGITTVNGTQHLAAVRLLRNVGIDAATDLKTVLIGGAPTLLQALMNNSIQVTALSPPTILVARDRFKMNVLGDPPRDFVSMQGGFAVTEKLLAEKRDLVRRMMRSRTKGFKYFHENEKDTSELLAKFMKLDLATTLETYRISDFAFTKNSILTDKEVEVLLKEDARVLGLAQPVPGSKIFDFGVQREVNQELGIP